MSPFMVLALAVAALAITALVLHLTMVLVWQWMRLRHAAFMILKNNTRIREQSLFSEKRHWLLV